MRPFFIIMKRINILLYKDLKKVKPGHFVEWVPDISYGNEEPLYGIVIRTYSEGRFTAIWFKNKHLQDTYQYSISSHKFIFYSNEEE